jgi:hypothetical protein
MTHGITLKHHHRLQHQIMDYENNYSDRYSGKSYGNSYGGGGGGYGGRGGGGGGSRGGRYGSDDRPPPAAPLISEKISSDRKMFFLDLKENNRGRVLKITEDVRGRRDTIMVPLETLQEFYDAVGRILDFDRSSPGSEILED